MDAALSLSPRLRPASSRRPIPSLLLGDCERVQSNLEAILTLHSFTLSGRRDGSALS